MKAFDSVRTSAVTAWLLVAAVLASCSMTPAPQSGMQPVSELKPVAPQGYVPQAQIPDSATLLPPPPAAGSTAFAHDEEIHRQSQTLRGTPRWDLARSDADLKAPHAMSTFDCAIGIAVTEQNTPRLYQILRRTLIDAGRATSSAKKLYQRVRPFVFYNEPTCWPEDESILRGNGSYPSGHTTFGWASALILAEVVPDRANEILARARAFGESRLVCNVHWQSDVIEGIFMGSAAAARMHAEPALAEDIAVARSEVAEARAKGLSPTRDCAAEAAALAMKIPGVL